ncbi:MAG TPA: SDR family NAD(P)-dependent oxidoreductase [Rugosimonospora sp.]|nr:SDR family NAD(P)-dependent oxidoreductase [Rugosimonospora sp.]
MSVDMKGKRVLVTGGTRGIGLAITRAFVQSGAQVVGCHRQDGPAAESLARELAATGGGHRLVKADVSRTEDVARLVEECRTRLGGLDAVVHNAGVISHVPFAELTLDEWRRIVDTNLTGAFLVARSCLPLLGDGSSIVFIGSKVATVGVPLRSHYTASKAGLVGLTRSMCKELGPRGIRVNVVAPGVIETEEAATLPPERYQMYRNMTSLKRLGQVAEVAEVVVFVSSPAAGYLTGETINVDGGA